LLLTADFTRITDPSGNPIATATAEFYLAGTGTTTLQTVYADYSLTTPLPNPVPSDGFGLLPSIYGDPLYAYDIVFKDEFGTILKTIEHWSVEGVGSIINPQAGVSYAVTPADNGQIIKRTHSSAMSDTLPAAGTNGRTVTIWDASSFTDTITVSGGGTINGSASYVLQSGQRAVFTDDGAAWTTGSQGLTTGKRFMGIGAAYLTPAATNGCATLARVETVTNKQNYLVLDFDKTTTEYAAQTIDLPPSYDGLSIDWAAVWTVSAGAAGETLQVGLQARQYADDDALDGAWGAASTVNDTVLALGDVHVTAWSVLTPANAGAGRLMAFRFSRTGATGTHANDLRLIGLRFRPSLLLSNDA
jgi:hypothetical protein